jgi:hypothetical protein
MMNIKIKLLLLFSVTAILQGCASLPSTEQMKAETASYQVPVQPSSGKALVYVVRPSNIGALVRFNIHVDSKADEAEIGYTRGGQYIYFAMQPGTRKIFSNAENWAEMTVEAKAGEIIYLQQEPAFGIIMARNNIFRIEDLQGKYYVKTLSVGTLLKPEGIFSAAQPTALPASSKQPNNALPNPASQLEQLDALLKKKLITQQDYDAKKVEILKNM